MINMLDRATDLQATIRGLEHDEAAILETILTVLAAVQKSEQARCRNIALRNKQGFAPAWQPHNQACQEIADTIAAQK